MNRGRSQVIELRLNRAEEMFVLDQTDLFSEYRNFLTGVEYCISLLRSQPIRWPVRLQLSLPAGELVDGLGDRLSLALRRYCDQRISYNQRERSATRLGGVRSLWIGLPIVVIGYLLVIYEDSLVGHSGNNRARHHGVGAGVGRNLVPARYLLLHPAWLHTGEPRPQAPARRRDLGDNLAARDGLKDCPETVTVGTLPREHRVTGPARRRRRDDGG